MVRNGYKFSEQKSYYTNCERSSDNDTSNNTLDESSWSIETETFSDAIPEKNVTMPAPEVTCELLSSYFGTVIDKDNISIGCPKMDGIAKWLVDITADSDFTDLYAA